MKHQFNYKCWREKNTYTDRSTLDFSHIKAPSYSIIHVQLKLDITRYLGPGILFCYIRYLVKSVLNKQYKTKQITV